MHRPLANLRNAIKDIPQVVKRELGPQLLGVFFMRGLGSLGITNITAYKNGDLIGAVVAIDVDIFLYRTANEWSTWKENIPFRPVQDIRLELLIAQQAENNRKSALQYMLLHEFGHILTASSEMMPDWQLDTSDDSYRVRTAGQDRSKMNVAFNLRSEELDTKFLLAALNAGFSGLDEHRSIGGIRASLYNGLELAAVEKLADFIKNFRTRHL